MTLSEQLLHLLTLHLGHTPTSEQSKVLEMWQEFLFSRNAEEIFLLRGFAGTGKTTLIASLVKTMRQLQQSVVLLAPTGRAAKVFSHYADAPAHTIHRCIYRQKSFADAGSFQPAPNLMHHTLFIVDEASMIANQGLSGGMFGTGRLLDDLIQFVYSGDNCRLILVGDTAQLPPVGEDESPALNASILEGYNLEVKDVELTSVLRQEQQSGILFNATALRRIIQQGYFTSVPRLRTTGFPDVISIKGDELLEALEDSYSSYGTDETIVVTRSNKRANIYNLGIRGRILDLEEELCSGDRLMVAKNNYFWRCTNMDEQPPLAQSSGMPAKAGELIANGEMAVVRRLHNERSFYGFRFIDATLRFTDHDDVECDATILLDTLQSDAPALTAQQQESLFQAVWDDYPDLNKQDRIKKIKEDVYYNALQVKYAYAVTCHKAQGGQWSSVFIDQGYISEDTSLTDYYRWLYTAITRATERVYLVNFETD